MRSASGSAKRFDDGRSDGAEGRSPRVFIAGDACHTHSPKAGQGMNVSVADGFNLGWKLAAVLRGRSVAGPSRTYSAERRAVAEELIDFDRAFAKMFSAPPKDPAPRPPMAKASIRRSSENYFVKQARFTAGVATRYAPSVIVGEPVHQVLAAGLVVGMRFHHDAQPDPMAVVSTMWFAFGYSMAFGEGNAIFGNPLKHLFLQGHWHNTRPGLRGYDTEPDVHALPDMMFAIITPALISGAIAERIRFKAYLLFIRAMDDGGLTFRSAT